MSGLVKMAARLKARFAPRSSQSTPPASGSPIASPLEPGDDRDGLYKKLVGAGNRLKAVDVGGAGDLQPHWWKLRPVCDFIVYEPNRASFDALQHRRDTTSDYDNFHYLNVGLADRAGPRTLYVTNVPTGSSLRNVNPDGISVFNRSDYFFPLKEEQITVDTLAASLDAIGTADVHIIKLDTQGTEVEILKGLDDARVSSLLAIELEAGVLDHYEGDETALEDALSFARSKGFRLFDLRCNRFTGSAPRYDLRAIEAFLGRDLDAIPSAQRLNEVDAIFFRETRHFIGAKPNPDSIRRFVALLCVYNFFMEAVAAVRLSEELDLLPAAEVEAMLGIVKKLFFVAQLDMAGFAKEVQDSDRFFFAQYMWVPVPST